MPAGDDQRHQRRRQLGILQGGREEMPFEMMHADEAPSPGGRQRLPVADAHQQCPHQARPRGHGHGVHRGERQARFLQRPADDRLEGFEVRPAGQLGDHAAKDPMHVLRKNHQAGELGPAALVHQHGGRGLVARSLDS